MRYKLCQCKYRPIPSVKKILRALTRVVHLGQTRGCCGSVFAESIGSKGRPVASNHRELCFYEGVYEDKSPILAYREVIRMNLSVVWVGVYQSLQRSIIPGVDHLQVSQARKSITVLRIPPAGPISKYGKEMDLTYSGFNMYACHTIHTSRGGISRSKKASLLSNARFSVHSWKLVHNTQYRVTINHKT
jgi:hypothetical protein